MARETTPPDPSQPEKKKRRKSKGLAVAAIVLPFVGTVFGATLEHGTNFLCKLGLFGMTCPATPSDTKDLLTALQTALDTQRQLTEGLNSANSQLAACSGELAALGQQIASVQLPPRNAVFDPSATRSQLNAISRNAVASSAQFGEVSLVPISPQIENDLRDFLREYPQFQTIKTPSP